MTQRTQGQGVIVTTPGALEGSSTEGQAARKKAGSRKCISERSLTIVKNFMNWYRPTTKAWAYFVPGMSDNQTILVNRGFLATLFNIHVPFRPIAYRFKTNFRRMFDV